MPRRVEWFIVSCGSIKITLLTELRSRRAILIKAFALSLSSPTAHCSLLGAQLLVNRSAQFGRLDSAEILEHHFAVFIVKISCGESAVPGRVTGVDRRFRIFNIQQDNGHLRLHGF